MLKQLKKNNSFESDILELIDELAVSEMPRDILPLLNGSCEQEIEDDVEIEKCEKPIRVTRKRLNEFVDENMRDAYILRLIDPVLSEQDIASCLDYLEKVKKYIKSLAKSVRGKTSLSALNQVLKSFEQYNDGLDMLKGLDEDIFIAMTVCDSEMPYSEEFADAILRMRLEYEENKPEDEEKRQRFENEISIIQELLAPDEEEEFSDFGYEFEEELSVDYSFQKCLLNQRKIDLKKEFFDLGINYVRPKLKSFHLLDSFGNIKEIFYPESIIGLYELNARLFSQKFVDKHILKTSNIFLDIQLVMKECFIPMFSNILLLKNTFQEKSMSLLGQKNEDLSIALNASWVSLCCEVKKNKKQKTLAWKKVVSAVNSENIDAIEDAWEYFEKQECVNIKIKQRYLQFLTLFLKNTIPMFVFSSKNIPVSPFELVKIIELVEKYEYSHLRSLLKLGIRCALTDFYTFISLPLLKCILKEMYTTIRTQINLTLKNIFLIYKNVVSLYAVNREIRIEKLKLVPPSLLNNEWEKDIEQMDDEGNTWLIRSILKNDFSTFCKLLKLDANINDTTYYGETPLVLLSKLERYDWIDELLKYKPNINAFDFYGRSCIHYFAQNNACNMLKKMTKLGVNLNWVDMKGATALHVATKEGSYEAVQFLLNQGMDVNRPDAAHKTVLHIAIEQKYENIVALLIENNANIYARDKDLKTCMHYVAMMNVGKMIKYFAQSKRSIDAYDILKRTPLHLACTYGHKNMVRKLLELGANANAKDLKGHTPLHVATMFGLSGCVDVLMEYGANVDNQDTLGQSSTYLATLVEQKKSLKGIVSLYGNIHAKTEDDTSVMNLIDDGVDRSIKSLLKKYEESDSFYDMILFLGIIKENMFLVKEAIKNRSHLKEITICDKTPLEWAIEIGNIDILRELYTNNCVKLHETKQNIGHRSLLRAILQNNTTNIRLLIKAGVDVNSKDNGTEQTVLHYASAIGNTVAIELLVQNGANINAKNIRGKTPLYFARQANQLEAEGLLLSLGATDDSCS